MIPQGARLTSDMTEARSIAPSLTYALDLERKRFVGMTDGLPALKQAIYKILSTERAYYPIYSDEYGIYVLGLLGQDPSLVRAELEHHLIEALLMDDRILDVQDYELLFEKDSVTLSFTVISTLGPIQIQEVI